jgi:hypothetical protein
MFCLTAVLRATVRNSICFLIRSHSPQSTGGGRGMRSLCSSTTKTRKKESAKFKVARIPFFELGIRENLKNGIRYEFPTFGSLEKG